MDKKKKTLLITGASGFVGSNFIKKYENEYNIISISLRKIQPEDINFKGVDCVLHLAALVHQMKGAPKEKYFEINTKLTERLANKAKKDGVKHFVFFSTVAVWGTHGYFDSKKIIKLEDKVKPNTYYAESKFLAEQILINMKTNFFNVSIIRPPLIYGDKSPGNMKKLEKLIKYTRILPFGNNNNKRSLVNIEYLIKETENLLNLNRGGVFLFKDKKDYSIKEIIMMLAKKNKIKIFLIKMPIIIIKILFNINPKLIESLFLSLRFKGSENDI